MSWPSVAAKATTSSYTGPLKVQSSRQPGGVATKLEGRRYARHTRNSLVCLISANERACAGPSRPPSTSRLSRETPPPMTTVCLYPVSMFHLLCLLPEPCSLQHTDHTRPSGSSPPPFAKISPRPLSQRG